MSLPQATPQTYSTGAWLVPTLLVVAVGAAVGLTAYALNSSRAQDNKPQDNKPQDNKPQDKKDDPPKGDRFRGKIDAPELEGGVAWLNTAGPVRLKDLRGKIVILDFWTLCCINCIHTMPDLRRLEEKYPNELVVIGVHSPKFENEKETESIRKAVLRYEVKHPVVNDAEQRIWRTYQVASWPTLYVIDPEGKIVAKGSGEGLYEALDEAIAELIKIHKEKKTLNDKPLKFELAKESGESPLFFPGKVVADAPGKRLFIADSTHHRIVITDLDGKKIAVAGTGEAGKTDGAFAKAQFNDPQGMAVDGDTLYVADRKNHLIRALNLKTKTVTTIAGTGKQGQDRDAVGDPLSIGLNSPWDLVKRDKTLYIAMAGFHQIWALDLGRKQLSPLAGTGRENLADGPFDRANFAQPSGLTTDGKNLYVADSEVSGVRCLPLDNKLGEVSTLVGEGLFEFGDITYSPARSTALGFGEGYTYRLQHALGVAYGDGKVYIADTYNNKLKMLDPQTRRITTLLGGEVDGWLSTSGLEAPGGISYADGKIYLADTNAHRIRVYDIKTRAVSTLKLQGVEAPKP
jgi:DNA-binding beta-propeller fold protein YncE